MDFLILSCIAGMGFGLFQSRPETRCTRLDYENINPTTIARANRRINKKRRGLTTKAIVIKSKGFAK